MKRIKVLYIDDEIVNLNAFKAAFRRVFDIHISQKAEEALEILNANPIEVIISDQRMPGKTGIDFFESILDLHPNPIRILLTAHSDIKAVIDAINRGQVYRYITKPWNEYELKLTIENAYQLYQLREQNKKLNNQYKNIFSHSSDPILLFDLKGRIIDFNKAADIFFGCKFETLKLTTINCLVKDKNDSKQIINKLIKEGTIKEFECQVYGKDNKIKICLFSANKITNNNNEIISYQAIIKDITKYSKTNQLILKKIIETQENERERIARDLHDGLGQSLIALKMHVESLKNSYNQNQTIEDELEHIPKILKGAIQDLRKICFNTLPLILNEYGLIKAVINLQSNVSSIDFNILFNYNENLPDIAKSLEVSIFRVIQEFINNSIKHSHSTEIQIDLTNNQECILLLLKDNGIGFNTNDLNLFEGYGLKNIQTRIDSFKGKIEIISAINKGTQFNISIPYHS